jgi:crotonobetainyl-CoA:carnitine CoA-transferase CaiB-like acyl-CoA transferase
MLHPLASSVPNGARASRPGNVHRNITLCDLYPAGNASQCLTVGNDRQFRTLCAGPTITELSKDPLFLTNGERVVICNTLRETLLPWLTLKEGTALFQRLMEHGVPCVPVLLVEEALGADRRSCRQDLAELRCYCGLGMAEMRNHMPGSVPMLLRAFGTHRRKVLARLVRVGRGSKP